MSDIDFRIVFEEFNKGHAPLAHLDDKTFVGDRGHASSMKADIISMPGFLIQSPGLSNLTNGTQAGVVSELIRFIMEQPIGDYTYGLGTSKMFKISATSVLSGGSPSWPQSISNMTEGESLIRLNNYVYGFYNKASGGDILRMTISSESITAAWGSATDQALEKAPHPCAVKEDIMVFGNGKYLGVFIEGLATLDVQKLNFGEGAQVADVVFHGGYWYIAVNFGDRRGQIFLYDGSALSSILSDETGVGLQKIGFLDVLNGVVYVAYTDTTSSAYTIGYLSGRAVRALRYFSGTLPDHRQKTLYKNTILFLSGGDILSFGASVEQLPAQISRLCDGGYATLGAIAAPFDVPLIASTDGSSNHRLAKFDGYSIDSDWYSVGVDVTADRRLGKIHTAIVYTKALVGDARADLIILGNQQAEETEIEMIINTADRTRHMFKSIDMKAVEDVMIKIDYSNGDTVNTCPIRKVVLLGNYVED